MGERKYRRPPLPGEPGYLDYRRFTDWINSALWMWARYVTEKGANLGYPSSSPEYRAMAGTSRQTSDGDYPLERALERAITLMPDELRPFIEAHYLHRGSVEQKAGRLGVGRSVYFERVNLGRVYLMGIVDSVRTQEYLSDASCKILA